jgi:hypothetical protein
LLHSVPLGGGMPAALINVPLVSAPP